MGASWLKGNGCVCVCVRGGGGGVGSLLTSFLSHFEKGVVLQQLCLSVAS